MKKFLIAAGTFLMIAGVSQAQTTESKDTNDKKTEHRQRGFDRRKDFGKALNLTEDQKKQFKDINESYRKQVADIRNNKSLSADEIKTKTQALRKEQLGKTQSLLTADQKAQLAEKRKQFQGKGQFRGKDRKEGFKGRNAQGGKGLERMKTKLGLSDDQTAKLKANQQSFREKAKAIHSNTGLSDSEKKDQMKALAKQSQESMKSILTPEQLEKMKAGRKSKGGSK